jgi:ribonucleoside-triphosphate reductase
LAKVIKRDGRTVVFDKDKIKTAVLKAFIEIDGEETIYAKDKARDIANYIESLNSDISVEEIQDLVEQKLMASNRKDVAKAYIIYRNDRNRVREKNSQLMKSISEKLTASNVENQNANVDEKSFGGKIGAASSEVMKKYALDYCMSDMAKNNHLNNEIYIHDLDSYAVGMHNCLSIPFDKLLANGFNTRQTDVRPAQSVNTAFQLVAVIFQIQSLQQFGGVSATHIDWTMVPYMRKSFMKHYIVAYLKNNPDFLGIDLMDMLFDTYTDDVGITRNKFDDWIDKNKQDFFKMSGLSEEDFYFDNKDNLDPTLYQSALYDTIIETKQASEGMFHNLNTLQSRSGNQLNTRWLAA